MTDQTFTWLHLSDFHFEATKQWQQDVVLESLMRDVIEKALPEKGLLPDAVFVTGDIAHGGKEAEYRNARIFFKKIADSFGHDPERCWFLVPGNHDVDRDVVKGMAKQQRKLFTDQETTVELLDDPETWLAFAARQAEFIRFTDTFLGPDRRFEPQTPWRTDSLVVEKLHVAVLSLNSAWASQDDEDERKLLIGEVQARKALEAAKHAHLRIALCHHPLDWLRDFDRGRVKGVLTGTNGCHFLLRGHLHETQLELVISPGSGMAELAAGACYQDSDHPHAVTAVRLDFTTRRIEAHVWSYSPNRGGFWAVDNRLYPDMEDGCYRLDFPKAWQFDFADEPPRPPQALIPNKWRDELMVTCGNAENLVKADKPLVCRLRDVYVPLKTDWTEDEKKRGVSTEASREREKEPSIRLLSDLIAMPAQRCFLIVGGPGSGKTTFLRFTALEVVGDSEPRLPLHLQLKDFGSWLAGHPGKNPDLLWQWAADQLAGFGLGDLEKRLGQGRVLWLLDGLDEIFAEADRLRAARIIGAFARHEHFGRDRLLVTTRPHALEQAGIVRALALEQSTARILALDPTDQEQFLEKWFTALYQLEPGKVARHRDDLWQKMNRNPNLAELRDTPLLLSMIATVYHLGKRLPERRADLYEQAVWVLLQRRYGPDGREGGSQRLVDENRYGLMAAALWMMEKGAVRRIGRLDFIKLLQRETYRDKKPGLRERADLERMADDLGAHSGLLLMADNHFSFIHLGFQEFLAARAIAVADDDPFAALEPHLDDGAWREVVLLTVGHLFEAGAEPRGKQLARRLKETRGDDACRRLALAVEAAAQVPAGRLRELEAELVAETLEILEDRTSLYSEEDRFALGLALGNLGDPRLGLEKPENWVRFAGGERPFWLSRFLVTNHDYRTFIEADGYRRPDLWDGEGIVWLEKEMPDPEKRFPEYWWDKDFNAPNQPVVGVSWHEARAFCRWLTAGLKKDLLSFWKADFEVGLPNNAEWGLAAGDGERKYPWGDEEPDATRANYGERLGRTSPVGIYPGGAAGKLLDLAGNVWEWNADVDKSWGPFLRGGSWINPDRVLASSYRLGDWAGSRSLDFGFRCRLGPPSRSRA